MQNFTWKIVTKSVPRSNKETKVLVWKRSPIAAPGSSKQQLNWTKHKHNCLLIYENVVFYGSWRVLFVHMRKFGSKLEFCQLLPQIIKTHTQTFASCELSEKSVILKHGCLLYSAWRRKLTYLESELKKYPWKNQVKLEAVSNWSC